MNKEQINALLRAARRAAPPVPPPGFERRVLTAVRAENACPQSETLSWFGALGILFPRLAWAAATVMGVCVAVEAGASALGVPRLSDGLAQLSDQWLLAATGF